MLFATVVVELVLSLMYVIPRAEIAQKTLAEQE
jgi:hypothetical protein